MNQLNQPDQRPPDQPAPQLHRRIATLLGTEPRSYQRVVGGYTPADRWIAETDHRRYFIKVATNPATAAALQREIRTYEVLRAPFMPQFIAADDSIADDSIADEQGQKPILILEDLSLHYWPPPWNDAHVETVLGCIHDLHATQAPADPYAAVHGDCPPGWAQVARNQQPFLALGLASAAWLDLALPHLIAWEGRCPTEGDALTHLCLRSDNLCLRSDNLCLRSDNLCLRSDNLCLRSDTPCIRGSQAVLIDWNLACLSNPRLDLGFWLPSLAFEGGPLPDKLLPEAPEVAAFVSGFFASRAGLAEVPDAPRVRLVQRQQLQAALPWAVRALDLPPLICRP